MSFGMSLTVSASYVPTLTTDSAVRTELETRLAHLQPTELLLPKILSRATEKVLKHVCGTSRSDTAVRVERFDETPEYHHAFDFLTKFYRGKDDTIDLTRDEEPQPPNTNPEPVPTTIGIATGLPGM